MVNDINKTGFDKFGAILTYSRFLAQIKSLGVIKFLPKEIKINSVTQSEFNNFVSTVETVNLNKIMNNIEFSNYPMSLSIIEKCLRKDPYMTQKELARAMSEYNQRGILSNYAYLLKLSSMVPEGLYFNISDSDRGYGTIQCIINYKCD